MNPLLNLLPFTHNDPQPFAEAVAALGEGEHSQKMIQQAFHRCISKDYLEEYTFLLPIFLPERLGCGSLLDILIEKDRPNMFIRTWTTLETLDKFHPQMTHIYGQLLRKMTHWTDLACITNMLGSPIVGHLKLHEYADILSDVFYQSARENNTPLFLYLLDQVDHGDVDEWGYCNIIEHKNVAALEAALPYMARGTDPAYFVAFAWEQALTTNSFDIFEMVLPIADANTVQASLKGRTLEAFEKHIAQKQARTIGEHISSDNPSAGARKI